MAETVDGERKSANNQKELAENHLLQAELLRSSGQFEMALFSVLHSLSIASQMECFDVVLKAHVSFSEILLDLLSSPSRKAFSRRALRLLFRVLSFVLHHSDLSTQSRAFFTLARSYYAVESFGLISFSPFPSCLDLTFGFRRDLLTTSDRSTESASEFAARAEQGFERLHEIEKLSQVYHLQACTFHKLNMFDKRNERSRRFRSLQPLLSSFL